MEHQATREVDEEGNITWVNPPSVSGPFYDETITDEDRLEQAWYDFRLERDYLLSQMDVYQGVLLYNSLSATQQTELAEYRQALLNLPNDYDTPEEARANIPAKPSWMN